MLGTPSVFNPEHTTLDLLGLGWLLAVAQRARGYQLGGVPLIAVSMFLQQPGHLIEENMVIKKWEQKFTIEFDLERKFGDISTLVVGNKAPEAPLGPNMWSNPPFPRCGFCNHESNDNIPIFFPNSVGRYLLVESMLQDSFESPHFCCQNSFPLSKFISTSPPALSEIGNKPSSCPPTTFNPP